MVRFGYFLSSEEHSPDAMVRQAKLAEQAGFEGLWISGHGSGDRVMLPYDPR
ncbi:MAG: hypothetical protein QOE54_5590 [Streptosporangiaceae bacterium]|jgi:alkanesulfonate monooxygenase SsuD/methylene tetrahydromethanopterin reductase-like flavin-dependent oxidoreductase (luciferase family)|nr:F420-dependent oxidoreductase, family protein [Streptosporangiaceae bacterium]MDX6433224.1 hypothetical protein [Streptosporangiaceae bacterium]